MCGGVCVCVHRLFVLLFVLLLLLLLLPLRDFGSRGWVLGVRRGVQLSREYVSQVGRIRRLNGGLCGILKSRTRTHTHTTA